MGKVLLEFQHVALWTATSPSPDVSPERPWGMGRGAAAPPVRRRLITDHSAAPTSADTESASDAPPVRSRAGTATDDHTAALAPFCRADRRIWIREQHISRSTTRSPTRSVPSWSSCTPARSGDRRVGELAGGLPLNALPLVEVRRASTTPWPGGAYRGHHRLAARLGELMLLIAHVGAVPLEELLASDGSSCIEPTS